MPVAPPTLTNDLFEQSRRFVVLLGPDDGSLPDASHEVNYLIPLSISRAIGSSGRMETISLKWDLQRSGNRLVDAITPVGYNRMVSVCWLDDQKALHQLAWGRLPEQRHTITGKTEAVQLTARIDDDLLGAEKLTGHYLKQPSGDPVFVDQPLVFNPRVDGVTRGNCSSISSTNPHDATEPNYWWLDTDATLATHGATPTRWTLARAVHAVCWLCNSAETYIVNPFLSDLEAVLIDAAVEPQRLLRNVVIELGHGLREALNALLKPLQFGWRIDHYDTPGVKSKFTFFSLRSGVAIDLSIARPGDVIKRATNNLDNYGATISVADLANEVHGFSSPIDYEDSWELWPAWDPIYDDDPLYAPDVLQAANQTDQLRNGDVWFKYALNEGKDYEDLGRINMPSAQDVADKLHDYPEERTSAIRRRRFRPCLSQSLKGKNPDEVGDRGYVLEVRNENNFDEWIVVDWDFEVLTDECAIRVRRPHGECKWIMERNVLDPVAPLRLTATIRSDFAAWGHAERRTDSPQGAALKLVLDLSSKFHSRRVLNTSRHYANRHEAITGVTSTTITVAGVVDEIVHAGERVVIIGSTDNDGSYTIASIVRSGSTTTITTSEKLLGTTADGVLAYRTEEAADEARLQQHCERARDKDDVAQISLSATVDRFEPAFKIGEQVRQINGRNLDLNASTNSAVPSYLTVVGINYSLSGEQHTEILTETFRGENYDDGEA